MKLIYFTNWEEVEEASQRLQSLGPNCMDILSQIVWFNGQERKRINYSIQQLADQKFVFVYPHNNKFIVKASFAGEEALGYFLWSAKEKTGT